MRTAQRREPAHLRQGKAFADMKPERPLTPAHSSSWISPFDDVWDSDLPTGDRSGPRQT